MGFKSALILFLSLWVSSLSAHNCTEEVEKGWIPLEVSHQEELTCFPATDLVFNGTHYDFEQASALAVSDPQITLADFDVQESDIWQNVPVPRGRVWEELNLQSDEAITIEPGDEIEFVEFLESPANYFRFVAKKVVNGKTVKFQLTVSRSLHSILLRDAIVHKLGYKTSPTKYLSHVKVKFRSPFEKEEFIGVKRDRDPRNMYNQLGKITPYRWIRKNSEEDESFVIQDLLVMPANLKIQNYEFGTVPPNHHKEKRVFRSLLVPFSLVSFEESVNQFSWDLGEIKNNHLNLAYLWQEDFHTSLYDAQWIGRKIAKLKREDYIDIVKSAHLPPVVSKLLVEKIISRRNSLLSKLRINFETMSYNEEVSGDDHSFAGVNYLPLKNEEEAQWLQQGEIIFRDVWDGYGSHFAWKNSDSLWNRANVKSLTTSKGVSVAFSLGVDEVNKSLNHQFSESVQKLDAATEKAKEDLAQSILTGEPVSRELEFQSIPYLDFRLLYAREIVFGSYLGTDNDVQLADVFGYVAGGGFFTSTRGLPSAMLDLGFRSEFRRVYTYTHLKPFYKLETAFKTSFREVVVPYVMGKWQEELDRAEEVRGTEDEGEKLREIVGRFKAMLGVGESLVITDALIPSWGGELGISFTEKFRAFWNFKTSYRPTKRIHILRKSDNVLHIYQGEGAALADTWGAGFNFIVPIVNYQSDSTSGDSETLFYQINIDPNVERNPAIFVTLRGLAQLFDQQNLDLISAVHNPISIKHKGFDDELSRHEEFTRVTRKKDAKTRIQFELPSKRSIEFYHREIGTQKGVDYESYTVKALNSLISYSAQKDGGGVVTPKVRLISSSDPGATLFGRSHTWKSGFIKEIDGKSEYPPYLLINYRWKGWEISRDEALKLIGEINQRFSEVSDYSFYNPHILETVEKIQLYDVNLDIRLHSWALREMSQISSERAQEYFLNAHPHYYYNCDQEEGATFVLSNDPYRCDAVWRFIRAKNAYRKHLTGEEPLSLEDESFYAQEMVMVAEKNLPKSDFISMVGGEQNIFITSSIRGFFSETPNALTPRTSNQIGAYGYRGPFDHFTLMQLDPLTKIQQVLGVTSSERDADWLRKNKF